MAVIEDPGIGTISPPASISFKALTGNLYGNYRNRKFTDIYGNADDFLDDYHDFCAATIDNKISDAATTTLFYLLYGQYGNSTIASSDEMQFKTKLFSLIFAYGPTWEKRLEVQKSLREMNIEELQKSATAIYNHAYNPSTEPGTFSDNEFDYINDQNVTKHKRSKTDAYAMLLSLLETDVTYDFLRRFKSLFLTIVEPELPLWYVTDIEGDIQ